MNSRWTLRRRSLLAGSAAGITLASTGLMPTLARAQPVSGGTLRISVDQAPSVLNPLLHRLNPEYMLGEMLYSGLTRLDTNMAAMPDLAESWSSSDDLTEWTFNLRPGVTFHDGSALTAADVVATFTAILDEETGSPARRNVGPITEITAVDDTTVLFRTSGPYADLPVAVAYTDAKIVPASILENDFDSLNQRAVGSGPFQLVSYEPEREVVVERNPNYYDPARPYVDRVEMVIYPDITAEGSALISGDTDLMVRADPTDFERLAGSDGIDGLRTPSGQFLNIVLGCDEPPFDDPRVRQALALTIDRGALVDFVAEGYGTMGEDTPINNAYRYWADVGHREVNIEQAQALMQEAGYGDGLDLTLVASERPGIRAQMAVAIREMARPAGFNIEVQTMPHATYLDQVWRQGNFYVGFYNMQASADAIFSLLYTSDAAWNETRWNNADFDAQVAAGRSTPDGPERAAIYAEAQELMFEGLPTIIPVFFDLLGAKHDYVQGFDLHPRGAVFNIDQVWLGDGAPSRD